jgi:hypothetical protein
VELIDERGNGEEMRKIKIAERERREEVQVSGERESCFRSHLFSIWP